MPSFDIVSKINLQEIDNAVNSVLRELTNRYDFKGAVFSIELKTKDNILSIFTSIVNKRVESIESALTKLKQEETV